MCFVFTRLMVHVPGFALAHFVPSTKMYRCQRHKHCACVRAYVCVVYSVVVWLGTFDTNQKIPNAITHARLPSNSEKNKYICFALLHRAHPAPVAAEFQWVVLSVYLV